ncbi:MAG: hypothetical protein HYY64_08995 [Candidatus Rokubacteria bacterium]|nr:hypothetical protein [Candidatus Rokubacteria bacterium]
MNHYALPPAGAYPLNKCLFRLKSDDGFRARFVKEPERVMAEAGLSPEERAALAAQDRDRLVALGAHPYLVFMAQFRLRMETDESAFEYF